VSLDVCERYPEAKADAVADTPQSNGHAAPPTRGLYGVRASEIQRETVEWLDSGRVPTGLVTVLAGVGGLGKSQWTCLLAARLSSGELGPQGATMIATAEDTPSTTVLPRLEALGANLELIHFVHIADGQGGEEGIELPRDTAALAEMIRDVGARLFIVDPLVAHLPLSIDAHRDQSVRRALAPLYRLAKDTGCAVVAVLHLNKSSGLSPLQRIGGSSGFGNAARSVLLLDRDPDDVDGAGRVLAHVKCNVGPLSPSLLYRMASIVLPAEGNAPMVKTSRLELVGESRYDGAALLDPESSVEESDCVQFLRDALADGQVHAAADIISDGQREGFSERALQRARRKVGAYMTREGFPSRSYWALRPHPTLDLRLSGSVGSDGGGSTHTHDTHDSPDGSERRDGSGDDLGFGAFDGEHD
jgi:hypothetical protein